MATEIYWPAELPCWLLENHEGQDEDIYARTEMSYVAARQRRMYTAVPHIRRCEIFLHGDMPALFHDFYERAIDVGALRFIAPFRALSGETRYYECEFVEPYDAEFVLLSEARRAWRVRCAIRLYGDGKLESGELEPAEFSARFSVRLAGQGAVTPTAALGADFGIAMHGIYGDMPLYADFGVELAARQRDADSLGGAVFMIALSGSA